MLKNGVQDFIKTVGGEGCYALSLCKIAEVAGGYGRSNRRGTISEAIDDIEDGIKNGHIARDMTVLDGAAFLRSLTLKDWTKEYKPAGYKPAEGDYLIAEWFNKRTGLTHFTLEYPEKWNSLKDSVTVKEGAIRSYRLYRVKRV
jgi:hypothetical protein